MLCSSSERMSTYRIVSARYVFIYSSYALQPYDQNERQLRSIIDAGADLELYDREGRTVLLQSIEKGNEETVAGLLKLANPSVTARTFRHGKSALHLACHASNSLKNVDKLLSHGANAMWTDNDGNTLLHEVATHFRGTSTDIALAEKLIGLKVPVDARNSRRRTALHIMGPISTGSYRTERLIISRNDRLCHPETPTRSQPECTGS